MAARRAVYAVASDLFGGSASVKRTGSMAWLRAEPG
jgi:hypothetical protein